MRILFMGTPEFAVASLRRLVEDGHEICGVFTQPDKPKNRGHKLTFSPVKEYALTQNIPVYQPLKMRDGEAETGVSIMYMAKELDAGDVILQKTTPIGEQEDAQALTARLAELGAQALSEAVEALRNGTASRTPQDASRQTYASMLSREMSPIDWNRTARQINCQVRGLIPWPCGSGYGALRRKAGH